MSFLASFTLIMIGLSFYLLPSVISSVRRAQHSGTIFAVNILFGWTVLGWIAALIWAIVEKPSLPGAATAPRPVQSKPLRYFGLDR